MLPKGDISRKDSTDSGYGLIFKVSPPGNDSNRIVSVETSKEKTASHEAYRYPLEGITHAG